MPDALLKKAREARASAAQSRRLAAQQTDDATRRTLLRTAEELEASAVRLEQQAFNIPPARAAQAHKQPEQMQQAQVTPPKDDEPA